MAGYALLLFATYENIEGQFGGVEESLTRRLPWSRSLHDYSLGLVIPTAPEREQAAIVRPPRHQHRVLWWGDVGPSLRQSNALAHHRTDTPLRGAPVGPVITKGSWSLLTFPIAGMVGQLVAAACLNCRLAHRFLRTRGDLPPFAFPMLSYV